MLEDGLANLESKLDRAVVISQLVCMMRQVEYPAQRFLKIMHQLKDETNMNLLQALVVALDQAVEQYLPIQLVPGFKKEVSDFFLAIAFKYSTDVNLLSFCISKIIAFASSTQNIELISDWILSGKVALNGNTVNCRLS